MAVGTLSPVFKQVFLDANGKPLSGARLYSFLAGTTSPAPVYSDPALTTPLSNPAIADSSGRLTFWLGPTSYKFEVRDSSNVLQYVVDNVSAVPSAEVDLDIEGVAGEALSDRDVVFLSNGTGGTTPGRWYKGDADIVDRSTGANIIGIVPQAIGAGASGTIRFQGKVTGFSGLTPGAAYFISTVAGELTSIAPTNARFIGIADSTTTLVITVGGVAQAQPADPVFNTVQISSSGASALDVGGGIVAGTGDVQVVNAAGNVLEAAIADGAILARVAGNETITGNWIFSSAVSLQSIADGAAAAIRLRGRVADNIAIAFFQNNAASVTQGAIQAEPAIMRIAGGGTTVGLELSATGINALLPVNTLQVGSLGGAAAGKIGISSNALSFAGGSAGHAFLTSGGGPTTTVDAVGNWTFTGQLNGNGAGLTGLNASTLGSGTVPSARLAGAYTGITAVGTLGAPLTMAANQQVLGAAGALGGYMFSGDTDTGMWSNGADDVRIRAGGIAGDVRLEAGGSTGLHVQHNGGQILLIASGAAPVVGSANAIIDSGTKQVQFATSSRAAKRDVRPLSIEVARRVLEMEPVTFRGVTLGDDRLWAGFVAEDVAAVDPTLTTFGADGAPNYVTYDRVPAYLLRVLQDVVTRVEQLEQRG